MTRKQIAKWGALFFVGLPLLATGILIILVAAVRPALCGVIYCNFQPDGVATIWAALIGLFGGLLALGAASVVGFRQLEILDRQNRAQESLAAENAKMERLRFNSDLFDRRLAIYESARGWLSYFIDRYIHQFPDGLSNEERKGVETSQRRQFIEAMRMADFLCTKDIQDALRELFSITHEYIRRKRIYEKHSGAMNLSARDQAQLDNANNRIEVIEERLIEIDSGLSKMFAPIMKLTVE